jgi:hypothetical protein
VLNTAPITECHLNATNDHLNATHDHLNATNDHLNATHDHLNATHDHLNATNDHLNATNDHLNATHDHLNATHDHLNATHDHLNATHRLHSAPLMTIMPLMPHSTNDPSAPLGTCPRPDAHSIKISSKMTLEQFISNNRGINDGGDLPQQLLANVYHDITHREIKTGTEFDDLAEAELMDWLRQVSVVNCLLIAP